MKSILAATVLWMLALSTAMPGVMAQAPKKSDPHANLSLFSHSDNCVACHNNLTTAAGNDVSIGASWRSTMMANSSRDPYWQASVRRETIDHPMHSAAIQDECAACHMPMPQKISAASGTTVDAFSHFPSSPAAATDRSELQQLAGDGVSCTVCHQISAERLGTRESFNANFVIKPPPPGQRPAIYGNYDIDAGRRTIMRSVTGFQQEAAPHIKQSELCASCHTLITKAIGADGSIIGELPEQMNYQEWQHSDFEKEKRSCQSCHMPTVDGPIRISSVLGEPRDTLARHVFVGGNAHMLGILNRFRDELGVTAPAADFDRTAQSTIRQLQQDTATVSVDGAKLDGGHLAFDVRVTNNTGHKFPSGYPSRRAWLHVTVRNAGGVVFESGAVNDSGLIAGADSDRDAAAYEPHYEEITSPDQVQIYESILGDPGNAPTTGLLTATHYLKDNRLLPRGFDKTTAPAEIAVIGGARSDADFGASGDAIRYRVAVTQNGPFTIQVELRYQSIGYRWATNLEPVKGAEPARFVSYYKATSAGSSVVVAAATVTR